ncbi:LamG-like jellyroll fold domain-containing protein [Nostoc sp.]|uniref:LamG-like jellyroll fold domain-containing protein n=1 Tax=Nostoc sp. TaxID=1180 RepID=UPI002FF4AAA2
MEISKLKTLTTPNLNDVLPILDINGGVSGKPILRKISLQSIFSLIDFPNNGSANSNSSGLAVPTIIKTVAENGDYFIGIDSTGIPYKITKADLLAGLTSSGNGDNGSSSTNNHTVFLSHFEGNTIVDLKGNTIGGNATLSTLQSKFNGSSLLLNGSTSLSIADSDSLKFGTGKFTIQMFVRFTAYPSVYGAVITKTESNSNRYTVYFGNNRNGESGLSYYDGNVVVTQSQASASLSALGWELDTWYYIGIDRDEDDIVSLWRNGEIIASGSAPRDLSPIGITRVGAYRGDGTASNSATDYFIGNIDELRILKDGNDDLSIVPSSQFAS